MTALQPFVSNADVAEVIGRYEDYLGPARVLLHDKDITDFYRNPQDDIIWAVSHKRGKYITEFQQTTTQAEQFAAAIVAPYNAAFNERHPTISVPIPYHGARFSAACPPSVKAGIGWVVRIPHGKILTLEDYLAAGVIQHPRIVEDIRTLIAENASILIAGSQGAGKTTLLNTVLAETAKVTKHRARWVIIEDTDELQCGDPDHLKLLVGDAPGISWAEQIAFALRTSSDRLVIGEIRFGATPFLEALGTGHPGYGTAHGGTPDQAMRRIERLLKREGAVVDRSEIAEAIKAVIVIRKIGASGRLIRDVVRVTDTTKDGYIFKPVSE